MSSTVHTTILLRRRQRAVKLYERGWRVVDIAHALQVSPAAVSQWLKAFRDNGYEGLAARPKTGSPPRLTTLHMAMISAFLRDAPCDHGIAADRWDRKLMQATIKRVFGVSYSLQHVGRLMKRAQSGKDVLPPMARAELQELLRKSDIARIRSRIKDQHGKR